MSWINKQLRASILKFKRQYHQAQVLVQPPVVLPVGPVFRNAQNFPDRIAIRDRIASYTYANIFMSANELSKDITKLVNGRTNERVLFMCPNDANYVITLWAIWLSGQIAVPLCPQHPKNLLLYYANDAQAKLIVTTPEFADIVLRVSRNCNSQVHVLDNKLRLRCSRKPSPSTQAELEGGLSMDFYDTSNGMILYTSGTTGSPKGVVLSHKNIQYQAATLVDAWKFTSKDVLLHTLPLHHLHGVINALLCPLYAGAKILMLKRFDANAVWSYMLGVNALPEDKKVSVYMAVPTIYSKLIDEYKRVFKDDPKMVEHIRNTLKNKIRLMVSGSAPLPVPIFEKWLELSGHKILERYGMTEIGMALSNVYDSDREPGYVGVPLPGVSVRLGEEDEKTGDMKIILECSNNDGNVEVTEKVFKSENHKGELLVKSNGIFKDYYNRPEATRKDFTSDGWFKTGDICEYSQAKNMFKMLGRKNVDIIKSGGYKISALEVETHLLAHPNIQDCAVVGLDDEEWGQTVAAVVVPRENVEITLETITEWASEHLPKYAVPRLLKIAPSIRKNSMGKVNKKELVKILF